MKSSLLLLFGGLSALGSLYSMHDTEMVLASDIASDKTEIKSGYCHALSQEEEISPEEEPSSNPDEELLALEPANIQSAITDYTAGGRHVYMDLYGCDPVRCDYNEDIYDIIGQAVVATGATLLHLYVHKFEPQGMTGIAVLSESHIAFHTWPEDGKVALDVFTCGDHTNPEAGASVLAEYFGAKVVFLGRLDRFENNEQAAQVLEDFAIEPELAQA